MAKHRKRKGETSPIDAKCRPSTTASKPGIYRAQHIRAEELKFLFRKISWQLKRGLFTQASGSLAAFIEHKRTYTSEFNDFKNAGQLPLGMSGIDADLLNALEEDLGIRTVAQFEDCNEDKLFRSEHIGPRRLIKAKAAVDTLRREFKAWERKHAPKPKEVK